MGQYCPLLLPLSDEKRLAALVGLRQEPGNTAVADVSVVHYLLAGYTHKVHGHLAYEYPDAQLLGRGQKLRQAHGLLLFHEGLHHGGARPGHVHL